MPKRDSVRIRHMLDAAREAVAFVQGRPRSDLDHERLLTLGLTRLLEVIGEASRRVSPRGREGHPEIPWLDIGDMRNRLAHGYEDIDLDIIWQVLTNELPPLIRQLEAILSSEEP
mgnify:CR=1 FL=1